MIIFLNNSKFIFEILKIRYFDFFKIEKSFEKIEI